ncbi:MAG: polysaccharide deacetylase family protein [Acidobacteria bacterium]|nr:MAG: polysaccharide deacetylase family protein [Acidobacteriota bacterium]
MREGARSRAILERELREPVSAFAYPHGAQDQIVQHLIGACGYVFGLSCEFRLSSFFDSLLGLPRIEVKGSDTLEGFVGNIEGQKADHVSLCSFRQTMV